jgi:peptide/nickel transport system permease protein
MAQFLIRRFLLTLPVLFGITFVTFALARILPGDPCFAALGEKATPQQCEDYNERMGFNDPIMVQFVRYLGDVMQGDFGVSTKDGRTVQQIVIQRLPMTIEIAIGATIFATTFGILLGIV